MSSYTADLVLHGIDVVHEHQWQGEYAREYGTYTYTIHTKYFNRTTEYFNSFPFLIFLGQFSCHDQVGDAPSGITYYDL